MAPLNWSNEYSVEVEGIDRQHQQLFAMLNELHLAMKTGKGAQAAPRILKRLVDYACEHFALEEALMTQANYPELARHKAEQEKLTGEVAKMMQDIESGKTVVSMKLLQFLRSWLQDHIAGVDKKYTSYLSPRT
jgi:hemerythrin-like metal-binding protein